MFNIHIPKFYASAPCAEVGGDVWFPEKEKGASASSDDAKAMCAACPFRVECAELAITDHINFGIWGGTTPRQRVAIRRARGIAEREDDEIDMQAPEIDMYEDTWEDEDSEPTEDDLLAI
jgi:WhiB family redox-sensing transcriptional regulator